MTIVTIPPFYVKDLFRWNSFDKIYCIPVVVCSVESSESEATSRTRCLCVLGNSVVFLDVVFYYSGGTGWTVGVKSTTKITVSIS